MIINYKNLIWLILTAFFLSALNEISSFSVGCEFTKSGSFNLRYSLTIQRPGMNPFAGHFNPGFESSNNAGRYSASADMFRFNYGNFKKDPLNPGLMIGFFHDLIMPASVFDEKVSRNRKLVFEPGNK